MTKLTTVEIWNSKELVTTTPCWNTKVATPKLCKIANSTVPYLVYFVITFRPASPSFFNAFKEGIIQRPIEQLLMLKYMALCQLQIY